MRRFAPLFLCLVAAAPARPVPVPVPAGPAVSCISPSRIRETRVRDDRTIDFVMQGGKTFRNTLPHACPELGFERAFGYDLSIDRLCSVDIITVVRNGGPPGAMRGTSCGLGTFQPLAPAK
ncbi:MAG TPA: hypothetical protein VF649_10345 [Sphingomonas sp.]|jgi:hypothetical protein|uniref:hypothetical protein n=1 Tax=Sphingomonas sp. TaxID=28214 RepID=UPI002ED7AB7F